MSGLPKELKTLLYSRLKAMAKLEDDDEALAQFLSKHVLEDFLLLIHEVKSRNKYQHATAGVTFKKTMADLEFNFPPRIRTVLQHFFVCNPSYAGPVCMHGMPDLPIVADAFKDSRSRLTSTR